MHQVVEFLSFIVGLVVTVLRSLYGTIAELLPATAWVAVAVVVFVLVLYSRLASRIDNIETALELLDGKLETVLSRLSRPRAHPDARDADDKSRT